MAADVFISYSRRDQVRVLRLVEQLQSAGISVWLDQEGIDGGVPWSQEIVKGIRSCKVLVLMASATSVTSEQVITEVSLARDHKKSILPLYLEPIETLPAELEWMLARLQHIELFRTDQGSRVEAVLRSLENFGVAPPGADRTAPATEAPKKLTNLTRPLTSFIGREREIAEVQELLRESCLVTLTGPGGAGKTRLALQVSEELILGYRDGVWLVELASLSDAALVPQTVAAALNVHEEPNRPVLATLSDYLQTRQLLLVLDNCEQLIEACASLANALLRQCPQLHILATSQHLLDIPGEAVFRVPSLSVPPEQSPPSVERLLEYEAVRLFSERAQASQPRFALVKENVPAVIQVCRQLDGIPLAIELAAARVKVLTVEQIVTRLEDRFRLLTAGQRTVAPRHQTLRAVIDWSYDLLSETERTLLHRLSVFAGGCPLEAAEAVCAGESIDEYEVLDLLGALVDKSLVLVDEHGQEARYRMLETIRQYAREKLEASDEAASLQGRHRDWYLQLAEEAEPELRGPEQCVWLDRLEQEHDNLRVALAGSLNSEAAESGLRLSGALSEFWSVRGYLTEGRERLGALLKLAEASEHTPVRAKALKGAAFLAQDQGDYGAARQFYEESLTIQRNLGDMLEIANSLNNLGLVAQQQGDYVAAHSLLRQSLAINRVLAQEGGIALSLQNLGNIAQLQGDYEEARRSYEDSLAILRNYQERGSIASLLNNLGMVAIAQGHYDTARAHLEESLAIYRELRHKSSVAQASCNLAIVAQRQGNQEEALLLHGESLELFRELGDKDAIVACIECLAEITVARGEFERTARLLGAAEALREAIGAPRPPADSADCERLMTSAREALGEEALAAAVALGRAMTLDRVVEYALETVSCPLPVPAQ
jgi:predicted ATPase/Tfp pilus assembly protein PilF